jgi:hypothetical protein
MATDGGSVLVTVETDDLGAFESQFNNSMQSIAQNIGLKFSQKFADGFNRTISNQLIESTQVAMQQAQRAMRPITVQVDTGAAQSAINSLLQDQEARLRIDLDVSEVERQIGDIGDTAERSLGGAATGGFNKLGEAATGVNNAIELTSGALEGIDGILNSSKTKAAALARANLNVEQAFLDATQAASDLTQAQLDLNQAQVDGKQAGLDVKQAAIDVKQAQLDAKTAQKEYNDAVKEYGKNSPEAKQASLDLTQANQDLTQANLDAEQAQADLKQSQADGKQATTDMKQASLDAKTAQLDLNDAQTAVDPSFLQGIITKFADVAPILATVTIGAQAAGGMLNFAGIKAGFLAGKVKVISAVTKIWTGIQAALNFVMSMNPISLVILAIVALIAIFVVAYKKSDTFKRIVDGAFSKIKQGAQWLWEKIKVVFAAIGKIFKWLWDKAMVLKDKIIAAWGWIQNKIRLAKIGIGIIINAIRTKFQEMIDKAVVLKDRIAATWRVIQDKIRAGKDKVVGFLRAIGNFITKDVPAAFKRGAELVGEKWKALQDLCKIPIKFVIQTVVNGGLIDGLNSLIGKLHLPGNLKIPHIPLPKGFATGGHVRGPGTGTSDSIPAMLSNNEYVLREKIVKKVGVKNLDKLNISGDPSGLVMQRYADGGLVGRVRSWLPSVDPKPYVWGATGPNAYDCSGLVGQVYRMLTGMGGYGRVMTTRSNFGALGFRRGTGAFTMGVNPGTHMAGNLSGTAFEAASTRSGIHVGGSAKSVSSFAQQWYLPQIGGGFVGGGGGSSGPPSVNDQARSGILGIVDKVMNLVKQTPGGIIGEMMVGGVTGFANKIKNMDVSDFFAGIAGKAWDGIKGGAGAVKDFFTFDSGGLLMPGSTMVRNGTGRPEKVLTASQWDDISRIAGVSSGKSGGDRIFNISAENKTLIPRLEQMNRNEDLRNRMAMG